MSYDCVVIGAGLAGSGVAAALAARGWGVLLAERRVGPHHKVCGEFLSPESQTSLRALGLYDAVAALGPVAISDARFVSRGGVALRMPLPGTAWGLSRYALDDALADGAARAGAALRVGVTATAVKQEGDGYTVTLRDGKGEERTVRGRAVVSACGRHPLPGLRPGSAARPSHQTYVGVKCHWSGLALPPEVQIHLFDGGYAGLSSIEGGRANLCMLVARDAFARAGATVQGTVAAASAASPSLARALRGGTLLAESACAVAPVDTERTPTPWHGYPRVGDAVAMIPPLCGDGMAMALRSAVLCAEQAHDFLSGQTTLGEWQAAYGSVWRAEFSRRLAVGRGLQRLLALPLLNDALLLAGNIIPPAARALVRATRGAV